MKKLIRRLKTEPLEVIGDLVVAHWKVIGAAATTLLIQEVDNDTFDWIVGVLGTLFVGAKSNNKHAKRRLYGDGR